MKNFVYKLWGLHILAFPVALLIFFSPFIVMQLYDRQREDECERLGNQIRGKIEAYRKVHGKLPVDFTEAGIPNPAKFPFYFRRDTDFDYTLQADFSVGETLIYSSKAGKWDHQAY